MLIASFSLPPDAIALEDTLRAHPSIELEAERLAAHSTSWTMPCLWITDGDFEEIQESLEADPCVSSIVETEVFDSEQYIQVEWVDSVLERINAYIDQEGAMLNAHADTHGWEVRFRFSSRSQFDTFRSTLHDNEISFELLELFEPNDPRGASMGLTPKQREALITARDSGYFEIPREVTTEELASQLEVSHQSLSELLRRGTSQLIDESIQTEQSGVK